MTLPKQRASCGDKVQYSTKRAADRAAKARTLLLKDQVIHGYKCLYCEFYHIGHAPMEVAQEVIKAQKKRKVQHILNRWHTSFGDALEIAQSRKK